MRSTERKRKPFMTARKWIVFSALILVFVIFLVIRSYQTVLSERWSEEYYVKSSLREYFNYSTISYAEKYVWDEMYWLVKGLTPDGIEKMVVWKDLKIVVSEPTYELLTEKEFKTKLVEANTGDKIEHIKPSYFRDNLSFEVQSRADTGHLVISFYMMSNGMLIDKFTLPK